jgi:hypothetical protein
VRRVEVAVELAGAGGAGVGAGEAKVRMRGGEALELGAVDAAIGVGRVVEEGDRSPVALGEKGAKDRHQRGDAAAAADQQDRLGPLPRKLEVPFGLGEADDHPGLGAFDEEVGDEPLRVALGRDLQRRPAALGASRGVAALVADAVYLDRHLHELAGPEALPGAVRPQGERHALLRAPLDADNLGATLAGDQQGAELFEVAVEAVRPSHRPDQLERTAESELRHDAEQRNIKCRHVNWRNITQW